MCLSLAVFFRFGLVPFQEKAAGGLLPLWEVRARVDLKSGWWIRNVSSVELQDAEEKAPLY